jgi:SOS-response transcriptional repressor LexA
MSACDLQHELDPDEDTWEDPRWDDERWETGAAVPVTGRQAEILAFVISSIRDRQLPPSLAEIARHFGMSDCGNGPLVHLRALKAKGWLDWEFNRSRTLRLARGRIRPTTRIAHDHSNGSPPR